MLFCQQGRFHSPGIPAGLARLWAACGGTLAVCEQCLGMARPWPWAFPGECQAGVLLPWTPGVQRKGSWTEQGPEAGSRAGHFLALVLPLTAPCDNIQRITWAPGAGPVSPLSIILSLCPAQGLSPGLSPGP